MELALEIARFVLEDLFPTMESVPLVMLVRTSSLVSIAISNPMVDPQSVRIAPRAISWKTVSVLLATLELSQDV